MLVSLIATTPLDFIRRIRVIFRCEWTTSVARYRNYRTISSPNLLKVPHLTRTRYPFIQSIHRDSPPRAPGNNHNQKDPNNNNSSSSHSHNHKTNRDRNTTMRIAPRCLLEDSASNLLSFTPLVPRKPSLLLRDPSSATSNSTVFDTTIRSCLRGSEC
jgi:hypothetical protein